MHKLFRFSQIAILTICLVSLLPISGLCQAQTREQLEEKIDQRITDADLGSPGISILVQASDTGCILYDRNAKKALKPASCNKIHTGAAALYYLGKDFRYKTPLYITGRIKGKILQGDLVVKGSGDPTISGRFGKDKMDLVYIFRNWAKALKKLGIHKIEGNIIGDDDYFDDDYFGMGWPSKERGEWYCAEISALSFNDNCVDVHWTGAKRSGKPASYKLNPKTPYIKFLNQVVTGEKGSQKRSNFIRKDKMNVVIGRGSVPVKEKMTDWCSVYNPTLYFVTILKQTLEEEGLKVLGVPVDLDNHPAKKKTLQKDQPTTIVATYESPPLMTILDILHSHSQNFYAEQLIKTLGRRVKEEGSFSAGAKAIEEFLRKERLWENGCVIVDGSGLSYLNRVSPTQLVNILRYIRKKSYWKDYLNTFSRGQTKGHLRDSFAEGPEQKRVAPRIYGKRGYIGGVVGLTGVVYNEEGKEIFYSILINGYNAPLQKVRKLANSIAFELARSRLP